MNARKSRVAGLVMVAGTYVLSGCSDDSNGTFATGGTTSAGSGGGSNTPTAGASSAGSLNASGAGNTAGGNAASGSAGAAGTVSGGTGGVGGTGGAGGTAGAGGGGGGGGVGGAAPEPKLIYDFETDEQGWASADEGVAVATDAAQKVTGAKSLKFTVPALAPGQERHVAVTKPQFWPGTVLVLHVYAPAGTDGLWLQAYTQIDNWSTWDTTGNAGGALVRGGWSTITYTVPETFPGGLQALGVQLGVGDTDVAFAGGDFFIDSITALGGEESCAGTGTGSYGFETADVTAWTIDGNPVAPDTAIVQSTDEFKVGAGSLKVSFTALPGGTLAEPTSRRILLAKPTAYCSQELTFNVWTPAGSEAIAFQAFSQFNNYDGWNAAAVPAAITRDGWTQQKYTLPAISSGGLQVIGVQIMNTGETPFTGDVYIDDVTW